MYVSIVKSCCFRLIRSEPGGVYSSRRLDSVVDYPYPYGTYYACVQSAYSTPSKLDFENCSNQREFSICSGTETK
jgi:hypothetical protein